MNSVNHDLIAAAKIGNQEDIQEFLLHSECDLKSTDREQKTALMWAAENGHTACLQLLLPLSDALAPCYHGKTALMLAIAGGHAACLQLLLTVDDARTTDCYGRTSLILAAACGQTTCLQLLLPSSDTSVKNNVGRTASLVATHSGHAELGELINAYAFSMTELTLLQSFAASGTNRKIRTLRV